MRDGSYAMYILHRRRRWLIVRPIKIEKKNNNKWFDWAKLGIDAVQRQLEFQELLIVTVEFAY